MPLLLSIPAAITMILGLRLGRTPSRYVLLISVIVFSIAFMTAHFTGLQERISVLITWIALFSTLGLIGPAFFEDKPAAILLSVVASIVGGILGIAGLFAFACVAHSQCL